MKAVVMAGGFGTRIQPLTHSRPKPMLPVMNKPMMEYTMMMLKDSGIQEFIVLLYFKPEIIQDYFKDGSDFGIKISYVLPDDDYGTAGAVKLAQELIGNENFIIISGDLVTDFDFSKLLQFHEEKKSKLSIGLTSVENPLQFGVVIANEEGVIEKFLEKPSWGEVFSDTINTGIYIVEPEILDFIPEGENFDFAKDLFPTLMEQKVELMAYNLQGYWRDVGNPQSYREVYEDILGGEVKFTIPGQKKKYPEGVLYSLGKNTLADSVEIIGTVVLGNSVTIQKNVKLSNTVIGDNVVIGASSKIKNSVFWEDIKVATHVLMDGCIICNDNIIERNVTAIAGLILAEGCEVGELTRFDKDVIIWPNKKIQPASVVTNNLILGSKYKNSIFEDGSVYGKSNIELSCEMATKLGESLGAQLPVHSTVLAGRDYDKNSHMIKRAFLGGLVSSGINILDLKDTPPSVLRYTLAHDDTLVAGVHIKRCLNDTASSEITFFNDEAMKIHSESAKAIEKTFFTEKFRRVDYNKIGRIRDTEHKIEAIRYQRAIMDNIDHKIVKHENFKVVIDVMHGTTVDIFPKIINDMAVEHVILNAYYDEKKLTNIALLEKKSQLNVSKIVRCLNYNMGFLIYPNAQQLVLVAENGMVLSKVKALYAVLELLNLEGMNEKKRVFLPVWAPDIRYFKNLVIERGKYSDFKVQKLKEYDLIATVDGNFVFTEFSYTRDAIYASLKIMELLSTYKIDLSILIRSLSDFYYKHFKVECPQKLKGTMMRKFLKYAKEKKSSSEMGVKIWEDKNDWVLMIPDQYSEHLNLYIQAENDEKGELLYESYLKKIEQFSKE
ncbi:NTP transferase domain-containing protein [Sulfurimonas sp. SWIR-19]|uniref:sugar phosphate nucleotidyltransferase n=1 Tax=Sulfurimonas sp. SWIR-19 TaxID=2878390 RepID=UPI001CF31A28|nr:sugar phosphate nucleotidyltransferase [Sulfurimonas sp. SWIR-19]UCN00806.1 NTP transferase domain-containing protein [Sulfurimonas sp. SWIR-19]